MYCIGRSVPFFLPPFRCNSRLRFVAHVSRSCRKNALVHTHPPPSFERFASLSRSFVQLHYDGNCNYTTDGKTPLRYVAPPSFRLVPLCSPPTFLHRTSLVYIIFPYLSRNRHSLPPAFRDKQNYVN